MTAIPQTRIDVLGVLRRKLFMLGLSIPIFLFLVVYTIFLVLQSDAAGLYKMVAIFISSIIYVNLLSGFSIYCLTKNT